jgi:hypothetical protein
MKTKTAEEILLSKFPLLPASSNKAGMELILSAMEEYTSQFQESLRQAVADYMRSEGCSYCQDVDAHKEHKKKLAELLNVEPYSDGSGFDFRPYRTKDEL